jgi:hypothetical protein
MMGIMPRLWRTTIEIWTNYDPGDAELEDLGLDVTSGNAMTWKRAAVQIDSRDESVPEQVRSFFTIREVD